VEKFLHVHPPFAFVVDARADCGGRRRGLNLEAVPVSGGEEAGSLVALTGRSQRPVHLRRADVIQARLDPFATYRRTAAFLRIPLIKSAIDCRQSRVVIH
jgi:hypothetical protein